MGKEIIIPQTLDLEEFIAEEAHDLRSPFNRTLGFLKLVMKGMDGPITAQALEDLNVVYQSSLSALLFLNGLVEIARLNQATFSPAFDEFALDQLIQQVVTEWKRMNPRAAQVELTTDCPPVRLRVDEARFRKGLSAWISFVVEFVQESPSVMIQVEEQGQVCYFKLMSSGKKAQAPARCDLSLHGYIGQRSLTIHQAILHRLEEHETGAVVEFSFSRSANNNETG